MHFDFPTFLVLATLITGLVWLIDALAFAPRRRRLAEARTQPGTETTVTEETKAPKEPLLVEYSRSFFPVILIVLLLRSFLVEPFKIPSGSMMPTLLIGDFILVNKFSYGIRLPVLNTKVVKMGEPQRGDVVVFRFPPDPTIDYIKRVVGVPGDRITYRNKTLYVNDRPIPQTPLGMYSGVGSGSSETGALLANEILDGAEHDILIRPGVPDFPFQCRVLANGPIEVPPKSYFVIGDNRDNSRDSRCWGFVPDENLVGEAFAIWMSWDGGRDGFPIAWERLGNSIQ